MRGTRFDPPTIKFEGSTDDSMMDIHLGIDYEGMNEFIQTTITCAHRHTLFIVMGGTMYMCKSYYATFICMYVCLLG